jgi:SpoVK/Ycf46/Vps4 family AAA+-type ATPase
MHRGSSRAHVAHLKPPLRLRSLSSTPRGRRGTQARFALLTRLGGMNQSDVTEEEWRQITTLTHGYSAADLKSLCTQAARAPLQEAFEQVHSHSPLSPPLASTYLAGHTHTRRSHRLLPGHPSLLYQATHPSRPEFAPQPLRV